MATVTKTKKDLIVEENLKVISEIQNKKSWRVSRIWSRKFYDQNDLEK
jgi:hypothetical protein